MLHQILPCSAILNPSHRLDSHCVNHAYVSKTSTEANFQNRFTVEWCSNYEVSVIMTSCHLFALVLTQHEPTIQFREWCTPPNIPCSDIKNPRAQVMAGFEQGSSPAVWNIFRLKIVLGHVHSFWINGVSVCRCESSIQHSIPHRDNARCLWSVRSAPLIKSTAIFKKAWLNKYGTYGIRSSQSSWYLSEVIIVL